MSLILGEAQQLHPNRNNFTISSNIDRLAIFTSIHNISKVLKENTPTINYFSRINANVFTVIVKIFESESKSIFLFFTHRLTFKQINIKKMFKISHNTINLPSLTTIRNSIYIRFCGQKLHRYITTFSNSRMITCKSKNKFRYGHSIERRHTSRFFTDSNVLYFDAFKMALEQTISFICITNIIKFQTTCSTSFIGNTTTLLFVSNFGRLASFCLSNFFFTHSSVIF